MTGERQLETARRASAPVPDAPGWADLDHVERAKLVADAAIDRKGLDLVALDAREVSSFADTFVLATGTSDRHVRAVSDSVKHAVAARGEQPLGTEGYDEGRWVLLDYGDVIVHIFQAEVREHYDLERLWSDAPPLSLGLETEPSSEEAVRDP